MFGFWSIQVRLYIQSEFANDYANNDLTFYVFNIYICTLRLPLFVIFLLFWGSAYGFKGGDSNSPQPSDSTFSPSAVQSSVSEVPVTGILPEEVGSRFFNNRPLKRLNLLQFVKGHVSSRHESTSHAQSTPGTSFQGEDAGLGSFVDLSLQSQETSSHLLPSPVEVSNQSTNDQSTPSLFVVGFESSSDPQSTGPVSPLETRGGLSHSILSTQTQGSASTSQGSSEPEWSGSSEQLIPTQVESGSYSGVSQSLSTSSQHSPVNLLYRQFDALPVGVSRQSTNSQSSPSVSTSTQSTIISSHFFPVQGGRNTSSLPLKPQGSLGPYAPVYPTKYVGVPMSSHPDVYSQSTSSSGAQFGASTSFASQGMSSTYSGSVQPQGTASQFAPGSLSSYPSVSLSSPQGAASQSAIVQASRKQFTSTFPGSSGTQEGFSMPLTLQGSATYRGSLQPQGTTSQFAPGSPSSPQGAASQSATVQSSQKQFTSSYGTQSGSFSPFTLQGSTTYRGSLQPQGTTSQFAPGSLSSYPSVSLSSPQGAASQSATVQSSRKQFTSTFPGSSGTQEGFSMPLTLQGSATYRGSLQPQGTTSQFAPGSPSSPQGAASQSATVQSSQKQFTSSYGTQSGSFSPFTLQGSTTYRGSLQPQGTTSQFAPGSLSSYPSVSLSSPQGAASQSATVQSSRKRFTSSYGTQSGSFSPFTLQGSTTYRGSLQPQGTTSQFAPGSPSSPQGAASQSATVQSSQKQFTSSYGTQSGSFSPFTLQGSTTYRGSLQPQGTTSQFAPGSPSSPQGAASQSATVQSSQKQFTSSYGTQSGSFSPFTLQGSTTYRGSLQPQGTTSQFAPGSPSSPQGAASQSATVQSSQKQFTSSYGTQSGSFSPFTLQGSTTYRGSLQPQGTTSQFAPGSPSSPQGAASQSATVQSSQKQFTSTFTGSSGTQEGFSMPLTLQGSTTYRGSLQPQGTTSQFAPGSLSSYPSVSLSSPQGAASQSATVQSSRKQFTSTFTGSSGTQEGFSMPLTLQGSATYRGSLQPQGTTSAASQSATVQSSQKQFTSSYGTQSGSFSPFTLQGSTTYRGSLQPQGTTSQFASASPSSYNCHCVSLSSPQGVASQLSQALQSYSVSQSQKSPRVQPSQGIQTPGATASQDSSRSLSSPMQSRFSSLSSAGGSSSGDSGQFVSAQGGSTSYGGFSLHSQSLSSKYTPGSHAYAKLGSSPLAISTQSTSDQRSNGLYSSDSLRTQGLHMVKRPSRLPYQAPSDSPSSNKISKSFVTLQRPTGSNLAPSLGLSAQAPSVMFSGILQTAQPLRVSDVKLYNQPLKPLQRQGLRDSRKLPHNAK
ncbi:hypothetical protein ABG768_004220 [Culter alburnus]|uniref:Mucin-19-like n=1 Tax=Culter alburnus TaxID=194366 RepID=A0AAW1ZXD3_CULAL